jgi:hypothetical protein
MAQRSSIMADPHVYGAADSDNRQTPADNGMRGEQTAPLPGDSPAPPHTVMVAGGNTVTIQEESGIAAAEAVGNTNTAAQGDAEETAGAG